MGNVFFFDWEIQLMAWIQSFESGFLTSVATGITLLCDEYFMIFVIGLVYWSIDKQLGRRVALALTATCVFGTIIKCFGMRRRPYMDNPEIKCIRAAHPDEDIMSVTEQGYSLPSLHSGLSVAICGSLARETKKKVLIAVAFILPLLIGLSRNYLGVHYPTDVMAGWIIGMVVFFAIGTLEHKKGYMPAFILVLIASLIGMFFARDGEYFASLGLAIGFPIGFKFEEKYVNFEKSKTVLSAIIRPVIGVLLFIAVKELLELPLFFLSKEDYVLFFLGFKAFRYAVATFVIMGLYPMLFKKIKFI